MTDHELYFEWLVSRIDDGRAGDYRYMLCELFHTIFTYSIPRDRNRATDGTDLRYIYANQIGADPEFWKEFLPVECTMFEMMVALAIRWDDTYMYDADRGPRAYKWFWMMVENTGLDYFSDRNFDKNEVSRIIERVVKRDYGIDGKGGLFATKDRKIDMRELEIWYQLNYFMESYVK